MESPAGGLERRFASLKYRITALSELRQSVGLPPEHDIRPSQWAAIESRLRAAESNLLGRLQGQARVHLPMAHERPHAQALNAAFGALELDLAKAYSFFDTYMDILTQRHTPQLGPLLAGCDVLAWDSLHRDHPALSIVERPLVYCDRGYGASTLREGIRLPDGSLNPAPLIQIPYSRLREKYNLTSIGHEAGHEAMVRLGLTASLPKAFLAGLPALGAPREVANYYALWTKEIGPDFWTFCSTGLAAPACVMEILALPPQHAFHVAWTDPHPPPYIRALLCFQRCREAWGRGIWDRWEREWRRLYSPANLPPAARRLIAEAEQLIPAVTRLLFRTRFRALRGRPLTGLFSLGELAPSVLLPLVRKACDAGTFAFSGLRPCAHLAVFRLVRQSGRLSESRLDKLMTEWLMQLGAVKRAAATPA